MLEIYLVEIRGGVVLTVPTRIVFLAGSLVATREIFEGLEVFSVDALFAKSEDELNSNNMV